jgi:hypothetical protein
MAIADIDGDGKPDIVTSNGAIFRNVSIPGNIAFEKNIASFGYGRNVVLTDLNADNKPELIFSDNNNAYFVLKNTSTKGLISFEAPVFIPGFSPTFMVAGDIDGDGKTDMVTADYYNNKLGVFRNTSTGGTISFDTALIIPALNAPFTISLSDIDGDGRPDIAVALVNCNLAVLRNTSSAGSLSFDAQINYIPGTFYGDHTVAIGDMDGDGKNDPVTSTATFEAMVSVLLNTYSTAPTIQSFSPTSGQRGDTITIEGTNFLGTNSVSFGNTTATSFKVISARIIKAVLDTGSSGIISLVTPNGAATDSGFSFLPSITVFSPASAAAGTMITIDGFGFDQIKAVIFGGASAVKFRVISNTRIEAVVGTGSTGKIKLISAVGEGSSINDFTFIAYPAPVITSFSPSRAGIGDIITITGNNFGSSIAENDVYFGTIKAKLVSASPNNISVIVPAGSVYEPILVTTHFLSAVAMRSFVTTIPGATNLTAASFIVQKNLPGGDYYGSDIHLKDLDGDSLLDLIVPEVAGFQTYRNIGAKNGPLTFNDAQSFISTSPGTDYFGGNIAVADFDGDGKPDILQMDQFSNIGIMRNISTVGNINFDSVNIIYSPFSPIGVYVHSFSVGDLNMDGKPDIAVANAWGILTYIYLNTTVGSKISFDEPLRFRLVSAPTDIKVIDIDNDQKPDIVETGVSVDSDSITVSILRNTTTNGIVSFAPKIDFIAGTSYHLQLGDVDGDDTPEIIAAENYGIAILRNTSTASTISFSPKLFIPLREAYPRSIGLNDLNGDGRPDIFTGQNDFDSIIVFQNFSSPGNLNFIKKYSYPISSGSAGIVAGDLDRDGRPEIVLANQPGQSNIAILKNFVGDILEKQACTGSSFGLQSSITGNNYQWQQNAGLGFVNISDDNIVSGTTSPVIQFSNVPSSYNNFQYRCVVDAHYSSAIALSLGNNSFVPAIAISTTTGFVCKNSPVEFTATTLNANTAIVYKWQLNGINAGTNSMAFSTMPTDSSSEVSCYMTTTALCGLNETIKSNALSMAIDEVIPEITINGKTNVYKDSTTVITAIPINAAGSSISYNWQDSTALHGWQHITGTDSATIAYKPLRSGDRLKCSAFSNTSCPNPANGNSNVLIFTLNTITGIAPIPGSNYHIHYYPNPVNNKLYIDSLNAAEHWQSIEIVPVTGIGIGKVIYLGSQINVSIDVEGMVPGYYIAVLRRKQGVAVYLKFIKL